MTSQPSRKKLTKLLGLTNAQLSALDDLSTVELGAIDGITAGTATASKALVVDSNKDIGTIRNLTSNGVVTFGTLGTTGIGGVQRSVNFNPLTKNGSASYSNIGLSATLVAGAIYKFRLVLPSTVANGTGGIKYCFKYTTATLTSLEATAKGTTASAIATQHTTSTTDQADLFSQAAVVIFTEVDGVMEVNAGGTVNVQMAQNTSNASDTISLSGSSLEFVRIA